jgi:hypothetical protein
MSDVLKGLGSVSLLRMFPNWVVTPKYSFLNALRVLEYAGSSNDFIEITERKPQSFNCEIVTETKQDEFNFMTFWKARKGGLSRFWFPCYPEVLQLKNAISDSATTLTCYYTATKFNLERIFIYTNDDDLWTAKVSSYVSDEDVNETVLTLSETTGKTIALEDVTTFGMLLLCKFDKDTVELNYENRDTAKITLSVKELMEYGEV